MKDQELFDLCKQVHEATRWTDNSLSQWGWVQAHGEYELDNGCTDGCPPLYTSDFLLDKLPSWYFDTEIEETMVLALMPHMLETGKWIARYETPEHRGSEFEAIADTPLKSLLKLTLALHKEGLLS